MTTSPLTHKSILQFYLGTSIAFRFENLISVPRPLPPALFCRHTEKYIFIKTYLEISSEVKEDPQKVLEYRYSLFLQYVPKNIYG